jgi:hypothetical protein
MPQTGAGSATPEAIRSSRKTRGIRSERRRLDRREAQKRRDYRNAEDDFATRAALDALRELGDERERLDTEERELEAAIADHDRGSPPTRCSTGANDRHRAIKDEVVDAASVEDANRALREQIAAIFVTVDPDGDPYLDFVLRDRDAGAPLIASSLWGTEGYQTPPEIQTSESTLVNSAVWPGLRLPPLTLAAPD